MTATRTQARGAPRAQARSARASRGLAFAEVYMHVPIEVVQARDPKGLYAKVARAARARSSRSRA